MIKAIVFDFDYTLGDSTQGIAFAAVLTGTTTKEEFQKHDHVYIGKGIKEVCKSLTIKL